MVESRYYSVGDWIFRVSGEAERMALPDNYAPFVCEPVGSEALLFELSIGSIPNEPASLLYTDRSDEDMPRIEVYRVGEPASGWLFGIAPTQTAAVCARIRTDERFRQATLEVIHPDDWPFAIDNATMLLYAFSSASRGVLEMHASVTVKDGKGYLFLGHSGTGKSTHSQLWQKAYPEAWLLNDDNPALRLFPNGAIRVYGTPWSGKTPCYKSASVPVGGIVQLHQAPHNTMRPLRLPQAYAYMMASCSGLKIEPTMMDALHSTIAQVIQSVPVYELYCLPDLDAARLCHDTMNP